MGLFGIDSTSNATDNRQAAGDNSNLQRGRRNVVTEAGGTTFAAPISTTSGITNSKVDTGTKTSIKADKGAVVQVGDLTGAGAAAAAAGANDLASQFLSAISHLTDANSATVQTALGNTDAALAALAQPSLPVNSPSGDDISSLGASLSAIVQQALGNSGLVPSGNPADSAETGAAAATPSSNTWGIAIAGVVLVAVIALLAWLKRK